MRKKFDYNLIVLLLVIAALIILPLAIKNSYIQTVVIVASLGSIAALGVRLIINTGQWSFGQAAFMTIGAYTSGLLVIKLGFSTWASIPLAGLLAAAMAVGIGYPSIRVAGFAFSIITMVFGLAVRQIIIMLPKTVAGSLDGITNVPKLSKITIGGHTLNMAAPLPTYYFIIGLFLLTLVVMFRIDRSRLGVLFRTIRESDSLAESLSINFVSFRVLAFAIAGFFTGLAGGATAHYYMLIHPDLYGSWQSIFYVVYALVGGTSSVFGPVLGSFGLTVVSQYLQSAVPAFQALVYAIFLLVTILLVPGGLVELPRTIKVWVSAIRVNWTKVKTKEE